MRSFYHRCGVLLVFLCIFLSILPAAEARHGKDNVAPQMTQSTASVSKGKILFIPHDNRPTSCEQTAAVVRKLGYEVVMPDKQLLGGLGTIGDTEALWKWRLGGFP